MERILEVAYIFPRIYLLGAVREQLPKIANIVSTSSNSTEDIKFTCKPVENVNLERHPEK